MWFISQARWILFDTSMGCRFQPTFLKEWTEVHLQVWGLFHKQARVLFDASMSCRFGLTFKRVD